AARAIRSRVEGIAKAQGPAPHRGRSARIFRRAGRDLAAGVPADLPARVPGKSAAQRRFAARDVGVRQRAAACYLAKLRNRIFGDKSSNSFSARNNAFRGHLLHCNLPGAAKLWISIRKLVLICLHNAVAQLSWPAYSGTP